MGAAGVTGRDKDSEDIERIARRSAVCCWEPAAARSSDGIGTGKWRVDPHYNTCMLAVRYVYILTLVVWLGGMITIGAVVAPAAFRALEQTSTPDGRPAAASVVGEVLRRFHLVGYGAGAILLITLVAMKLIGPRPQGFGIRLALVAVMLAASACAGLLVDGRIAQLRESIGQPVSSLSENDPRRVRFGQLHGLSTGLMGLSILGGLALCYWETRE